MEMASRVEDSFAFPEAIKGADTASNKDEQHSKVSMILIQPPSITNNRREICHSKSFKKRQLCQKHQRKKMSFLSVTRAGYASWVRSESNILSHPVELSQTVERSDGGRREISIARFLWMRPRGFELKL
ncbi:hypothetical protein OIU76_000731 [Salix suchowensis]|nr:hypothetical protein OIU76_000731 [Salix suchowensis]